MLEQLAGYGLAFGLTTAGIFRYLTSEVFDREAFVWEPPETSIVLCTLNEEGFVREALESLEDQNVRRKYPEKFEVIVVDSHSTDRTVEIAREHADVILEAPRGKLTSKHMGIEKAKGDVILTVDADTIYPSPNWMNLVLRHFRDENVVAVTTPRLVNPKEGPVFTGFSVWIGLLTDVTPLALRITGQGAAFRKSAYFEVGGHDLTVNQLDVHEMVREEEVRFAWKLKQLGRVVAELKAPTFTSGRRTFFIGADRERYEKYAEQRLRGERF